MFKVVSQKCLVLSCLWIAGNALCPLVTAAEPEVVSKHTREFRILIDGKARGHQEMTFSRRADDSEVMQGEAIVDMNFVVYRYRYSSTGSETWKDGRLIQLVNEANYNGDKYVIQGAAVQQSLHYEVNGETQKAPSDIWAASYWREPEPKRVGKKVKLLDSDKGKQMTGTLEKLDSQTITVDSKPVKANHYHIHGDVEVEVWYDKQGLIVRQESVESGHKTRLELVKITQQVVATQATPATR
jgi:hypothetical protein